MKKFIVESIKEEYRLAIETRSKPRIWGVSVFLQPRTGMFLYDDRYCDSGVILEMIKEGKLVFLKFESHQGEKMVRYGLNENIIKTLSK